jgi:hypothetical protein
VNPYFVWDVHEDGAGWRPFARLMEPGVVAERVAASRQGLVAMFGLDEAAVPERVVASVLFLGYASRLVSPLLAESLGGSIRDVGPADLWWRPVPGGPLPVAVAGAAGRRPAADLFDVAVLGLVAPLLEVFRVRFRLSPHVLWGNVASALGGAAGQLPEAAWPAVAGLLERAPLAGTATVGRRALRRRNCCLYYRIPGGGTCGDCILTRP